MRAPVGEAGLLLACRQVDRQTDTVHSGAHTELSAGGTARDHHRPPAQAHTALRPCTSPYPARKPPAGVLAVAYLNGSVGQWEGNMFTSFSQSCPDQFPAFLLAPQDPALVFLLCFVWGGRGGRELPPSLPSSTPASCPQPPQLPEPAAPSHPRLVLGAPGALGLTQGCRAPTPGSALGAEGSTELRAPAALGSEPDALRWFRALGTALPPLLPTLSSGSRDDPGPSSQKPGWGSSHFFFAECTESIFSLLNHLIFLAPLPIGILSFFCINSAQFQR